MKACQGCARRSIEPNCHNAKTCEHWAKHMAERERIYAERELAQLSSQPSGRYRKSLSKNGMYIRGEYRPIRPKGRTVIQGGEKR